MIVSLHIAAMFAPSPISGRLVDRLGGARTAAFGAVLLAAASVTAVLNTHDTATLTTALILLGTGWNVAVVAGSTMLTARTAPRHRPRLEATGEVGMGVAGAAGSAVSGPILLAWGYPGLGVACAAASAALMLVLLLEWRRPAAARAAPPRPADAAGQIRLSA
jgi:predicted MFS family arabinose efflux permease